MRPGLHWHPMQIQVTSLGNVVRATTSGGLLRRAAAGQLCAAIEVEATACATRPGLLVDLGGLSRATPAAGLYAIRRLRTLPVERIALFGANRLMRGFAGLVLFLGRFPEHRFFANERAATEWLTAG